MKNLKKILMAFGILSLTIFQASCQNTNKKGNEKMMNQDKDMAKADNFPKAKSKSEWKKELSSEQYEIMVNKGTETPFHNAYYDNTKKGVYVSAATGDTLFSSEDKFHSGTGWPSFTKPINDNAVIWVKDNSMGMNRNEVVEKTTGLHLGHVFEDGPAPTHLRYCLDSAALVFKPSE